MDTTTDLYIVLIEFDGSRSICDSIAICLKLDICLRSIAEEGRIAIVLVYGLCVKLNRSGPVVFCKRLVALLFECGGGGFVCGL